MLLNSVRSYIKRYAFYRTVCSTFNVCLKIFTQTPSQHIRSGRNSGNTSTIRHLHTSPRFLVQKVAYLTELGINGEVRACGVKEGTQRGARFARCNSRTKWNGIVFIEHFPSECIGTRCWAVWDIKNSFDSVFIYFRMKVTVLFLGLLLIGDVWSSETSKNPGFSDRFLSRHKRYLIFPPGAAIVVIIITGIVLIFS